MNDALTVIRSLGELILVVEDNEKNLKLARSVLKFGGLCTSEATSADAALELVRDQTPDLILMDIQLPGMDGIAALKALKGDPPRAISGCSRSRPSR